MVNLNDVAAKFVCVVVPTTSVWTISLVVYVVSVAIALVNVSEAVVVVLETIVL